MGTGILQRKDEPATEADTGSHRFQILHIEGAVLVNVYLPSNSGTAEGNEEYEIVLKELEERLEQEAEDKKIILAGDVNYQPHHHIRRLEALTALASKFGLTHHVPSGPTYFGYNGDRSTLDQCLTSSGVRDVKYKIVTNEYLPSNTSTLALVNWTMKFEVATTPKPSEEESQNETALLFKKYLRVDWEGGIDRELYNIKEESYLRVGLQICSGLPPAWKISVMQDLLSEASDTARIRRIKTPEEDKTIEISSLETTIRKIRRSGYFPKWGERHWSSRQLLEAFPDKRKKIAEIFKLEKELSKKKRELGLEMTEELDQEEEDKNEELILALIEGRSRDFYSGVKNTKIVKNEVPKSIFHNNKWYYNDDVFQATSNVFCQ